MSGVAYHNLMSADIDTDTEYVSSCVGCGKRFHQNNGLVIHVRYCDRYKALIAKIHNPQTQTSDDVTTPPPPTSTIVFTTAETKKTTTTRNIQCSDPIATTMTLLRNGDTGSTSTSSTQDKFDSCTGTGTGSTPINNIDTGRVEEKKPII